MIGWWFALASVAQAAEIEGRTLQWGDAAPVEQAQLQVGDEAPVRVDPRGRFRLDLPDGVESVVRVTSPNHLPLTVQVTPPLDKPLRIFLRPLPPTPEIVVEAFQPSSDMTRHHVDAEMAYETPGTHDDSIRLVASLPGVNVQREYSPSSGEVSVRGSLPGENRYFLDGIELPYLYHYNQYASVVPSSQLSSLDLYSSGFGARFGGATGAIVSAESAAQRPDGVSGSATLNLITVGAEVRVPLPKRWWLGVSARRSFHDVAGDTSEQFPLWPRFYDVSTLAVNETDTLRHTLSFLAAGDRWDRALAELDVLDPVEAAGTPKLRHQRDFQRLGYALHFPGGRLATALTHDRVDTRLAALGRADLRTVSLPIRFDLARGIDEHWSWSAGAEWRNTYAWNQIAQAGPLGSLATIEAPTLGWQQDIDDQRYRSRLDAYAEVQAHYGPVRILPGVRVGLDSAGWIPTFEPRLAARWRVADQTELRLGGGRYQQRPSNTQLARDPNLPTASTWSGVFGIDQTFGGRLELVAEGYVKASSNVIWQPVDGPPEVAEEGLAYGGELTVRYRMREKIFLWAWFAYGRAFLFDEERGGRFPAASDQPWSGGLVASYDPIPPLRLALRWRIASGLPYTPATGSLYDGGEDSWQPVYGVPNGARMPLYTKIDLRVAYTFTFRDWALTASADLWIVPPPTGQLYPVWSYDYQEQGYVTGPPVLPLVGLRATF